MNDCDLITALGAEAASAILRGTPGGIQSDDVGAGGAGVGASGAGVREACGNIKQSAATLRHASRTHSSDTTTRFTGEENSGCVSLCGDCGDSVTRLLVSSPAPFPVAPPARFPSCVSHPQRRAALRSSPPPPPHRSDERGEAPDGDGGRGEGCKAHAGAKHTPADGGNAARGMAKVSLDLPPNLPRALAKPLALMRGEAGAGTAGSVLALKTSPPYPHGPLHPLLHHPQPHTASACPHANVTTRGSTADLQLLKFCRQQMRNHLGISFRLEHHP